ncbi:MAG: hypothetical protein JWM25_790 [Thermoleophilia bacterium]|nr:hypothetical protein [Thermoleophilia bacterium]MCZ4496207.1 hypothetical protein [Thermoleophilia bacterium]
MPGPLLVVVALLLFFAPALVAQAVTGTAQPGNYLTHPHRGWVLLADVLTSAPSAEAASPGAALRIAHRRWNTESGLEPRTAQLVHLDANDQFTVPLGTSRSRVTVGPGSALAWVIEGTTSRSDANVVIGVIDYESGAERYDLADHERPDTESDTP